MNQRKSTHKPSKVSKTIVPRVERDRLPKVIKLCALRDDSIDKLHFIRASLSSYQRKTLEIRLERIIRPRRRIPSILSVSLRRCTYSHQLLE